MEVVDVVDVAAPTSTPLFDDENGACIMIYKGGHISSRSAPSVFRGDLMAEFHQFFENRKSTI